MTEAEAREWTAANARYVAAAVAWVRAVLHDRSATRQPEPAPLPAPPAPRRHWLTWRRTAPPAAEPAQAETLV